MSTLAANYHLQLVPGCAPLRALLKVLVTVDAATLEVHHHHVPDEGHEVGVLLAVAGLPVQLEAEGGEPGQPGVQRAPHHRQHDQESQLRAPDNHNWGEILKIKAGYCLCVLARQRHILNSNPRRYSISKIPHSNINIFRLLSIRLVLSTEAFSPG